MDCSEDDLEELIGSSLVTVEGLRVEAGKVEEFARAIGSDDPVFRGTKPARRTSNAPAPPTFTRTAVFPRYRPDDLRDIQDATLGFDLGFDDEYRVHGEHEYEFERPLFVGDTLTGESTLADAYQRPGRGEKPLTFAVLETEYRDEQGDRVLAERATFIENPAGFDGGRASSEATYEVGETSVGDRVRSIEEVSVGDEGPRIVEAVDRKDFVRYAGTGGGLDRYHYDEPYARAAGYESVFGQGMLAAGYASRVVTRWFGVEAIDRFATRFLAPIWPDDRIAFQGVVIDRDERGAEIELVSKNQRGEEVLSGTASVSLDPES